MHNSHSVAVALALAAICTAAPAPAQMYKWVDERGTTHYSDTKPDDPKVSDKVRPVNGSLSVYSPDKSLLRAVEVARERANQPPPPEPAPRFYAAPAAMQAPLQYDPCLYEDCGNYYYPAAAYPVRRRVPFAHAAFPPGATAGTINSPGIIPGNSGTTPTGTAGHPEPVKPAVRPRPRPTPHSLEPRVAVR